MKNIHILPTDKPSRLVLRNADSKLVLHTSITQWHGKSQHIYITFNEKPKVEDWIFANQSANKITDIKEDDYPYGTINILGEKLYHSKHWSNNKIVLTDDPKLIKDGVQAIDDKFLEWFVKNPTCERVEVQKWASLAECGYSYHIIIPKEEPKCTCKIGELYNNACCKVHGSVSKEELKQDFSDKNYTPELELLGKQETLEEAAEKYAKQFDYAEDSSPQIDFIAGANWKAERSISIEAYEDSISMQKTSNIGFESKIQELKQEIKRMHSKEDMQLAFKAGQDYQNFDCQYAFEKWFEQFKKKK